MSRTLMRRWLAVAAVLMVGACSDAGSPAEPASGGAQFSVASDAAHDRHELLRQQLEARKAEFKAQREANRDELKAARAEWQAWKSDWKEQYKQEKAAWKRAHPGEKGGPDVDLLRCEPKEYAADAAIIGPNGGTLHVGPHELVIPKGALAEEQLITAEAPTSSLVDVELAPHGLQFLASAQLKLSYKGCVRPTDTDLRVAYLSQGNQVLELPPSKDDKLGDIVEALIDHFSRYAIAY
jgi:hypothetical protein